MATSIKMLREHLCQDWSKSWPEDVREAVHELVALIDYHRPLGNDGKHDNRHTLTCGCDDRPTKCNRPVGTKPYWMGNGQYDQCYCILSIDHLGQCKCTHTIEE